MATQNPRLIFYGSKLTRYYWFSSNCNNIGGYVIAFIGFIKTSEKTRKKNRKDKESCISVEYISMKTGSPRKETLSEKIQINLVYLLLHASSDAFF